MFASIPTLIPQDAHIPWHASNAIYTTYTSNSPTASSAPQSSRHPAQCNQQTPPPRTLLNILRVDETAVEIRKANVRRFGAGWLKPPGVSKTLQGMWDEKAEREEQEAAQAREQALADAQAAAAEAEAEAQNALAMGDGDGSGAEERDLDDDIPEADDTHWLDDDDAEDAMPTEEGDGDYAEDAVTAEAAGEIEERDLDDDVPEAGSYQHTDTDLEDSSNEAMDEDMREVPGQAPVAGNVSAAALESSIFGSSPVGQTSGARSRGYSGRARGREN